MAFLKRELVKQIFLNVLLFFLHIFSQAGILPVTYCGKERETLYTLNLTVIQK